MAGSSEMTIAGVLLHKHAGGRWHYYRGVVDGLGVTFRPTLAQNGKPAEWRAYAQLEGAAKCIAAGDTLTLVVQRAIYSLTQRKPKEAQP